MLEAAAADAPRRDAELLRAGRAPAPRRRDGRPHRSGCARAALGARRCTAPPAAGRRRRRADGRGAGRAGAGRLQRLVRAVPPLDGQRRRHRRPVPTGAARHAARRHRPPRLRRRPRLRHPLPAADPPDRAGLPQGSEQRAGGRPRRPGQPVGDRWGRRRPHRGAPRPRHPRRRARPGRRGGRERHRAGARPRLPVLARPPLGDRAPRVVPPPARRHDPVRREPARRSTRTSTRSTSSPPAWLELWEALLDVVEFWIDHGVTVFRVDNPHTKPFAVLGVADRAGAPPRTPT